MRISCENGDEHAGFKVDDSLLRDSVGGECDMLYVKYRKVLVLFRRFPGFACTSFLQ
jgi:hypothetical protein